MAQKLLWRAVAGGATAGRRAQQSLSCLVHEGGHHAVNQLCCGGRVRDMLQQAVMDLQAGWCDEHLRVRLLDASHRWHMKADMGDSGLACGGMGALQ